MRLVLVAMVLAIGCGRDSDVVPPTQPPADPEVNSMPAECRALFDTARVLRNCPYFGAEGRALLRGIEELEVMMLRDTIPEPLPQGVIDRCTRMENTAEEMLAYCNDVRSKAGERPSAW
ncbi:MAG: hypothetical protein JNL83_08110 [Myxococcales bacterium]|nr:hypothetical protein [Myxococcales bacterium]